MTDANFLKRVKIFRDLTDEDANSLLETSESRSFSPGDRILSRGDPGDAMAVLVRGAVRIPVVDDDGRTRFSAYLGPGDFFGEMALLTGEPRAADVIADGEVDCECLFFDRDVITGFMHQNPKVARFLTEILGERLMQSGAMRHVGKYHLMGELGRGGGGIVYEGFHPTLNRSVAVKMLAHELVYEGDFAERFLGEAMMVADLRHENIVQVYDCESAYATFFLVMERLDGVELSKMLEDGPLTPEEAKHIMRQVARALQYAHRRGLVHQDIKPGNIFLEDSGRLKLMDFGIASNSVRERSENERVPSGVMGTPGFVAPEVMIGKGVDGRADIYALGIMAYEMLVGEQPFAATETLGLLREQLKTKKVVVKPEHNDKVPPMWREFIERATQHDADARYQGCGEILELFDEPGETDGELQGTVVTVMYSDRDRDRVEEILSEVGERLAEVQGVRLSIGELAPFS